MKYSMKHTDSYRRPKMVLPAVVIFLFMILNQPTLADDTDEFSMHVYDAFAITGNGTVITGLIKSGTVTVGAIACVPLTNGDIVSREVTGIERLNKILERAETGQTVGLLVTELKSSLVAKGEILTGDCEPPAQEAEE